MVDVIHIIGADTPADMLNELAALADPGETIVSIGPAPTGQPFARKTVSIRAPLDNAAVAGVQLRKLADQAQLLHAWSPAAADAARWAASGRHVLFSLSHLRGVHQADIAVSGVFDGLWRLTVPTEAQRHVLITLGLNPKHVFVLPPAAPPNDRAARKRIRNDLGLDDRCFLLAAGGEMTRANGHKRACWAHALARILIDHTRIVFPGNGPARQIVESFARSTGYENEIFFTGGDLDPSDALAAADAAVFLQRHDCGVGALADAMACGLPILASDRPEIASLAPPGRAALLSPPGDMRQAADNLLTLTGDPELQHALGDQASILAAKHFAPDIAKNELHAIYSSVLSGRS